jgi:hypothetical protein
VIVGGINAKKIGEKILLKRWNSLSTGILKNFARGLLG